MFLLPWGTQVLAVGRERAGDAKFKAYLNLLASIINIQVRCSPTLLVPALAAGTHGLVLSTITAVNPHLLAAAGCVGARQFLMSHPAHMAMWQHDIDLKHSPTLSYVSHIINCDFPGEPRDQRGTGHEH